MTNFFSIIIPMYNKANTIVTTVHSIIKQTYNHFELIIVDDGSNDESYEIVKKINDSHIKLYRQNNSGVSAARNYGVSLSNGNIICFLDADDEWKSDFLTTVNSLFESFPEAAMVCPSYVIRLNGRELIPKWKSVDSTKDSLVTDFFEMASGSNWIMNSSCVAIKKEVLLKEEVIFPNEVVYEDFDLWIRIGSKYPVAHSNKICAVYNRSTPGNVRDTMNRKIIYSKSYFTTLNKLKVENANNPLRVRWIREIYDRRMVVYIYSLLSSRNRKLAKKEIFKWNATNKYTIYKIGLLFATLLPYRILDFIRYIRYKKI